MRKKGVPGSPKSTSNAGFVVQINLTGLIVFSLALVAAAGLVTYGLVSRHWKAVANVPCPPVVDDASADSSTAAGSPAPWGELVTSDIELEQPEEYVGFDSNTNQTPTWVFSSLAPDRVRALLVWCGMSADQADRFLVPEIVDATTSNTTVHPGENLILAMDPKVRAKLYAELSHDPVNHFMRFPVCFPGRSFEERFGNNHLSPAIVELMRKLLYTRGDIQCFSDLEIVQRHLSSEKERLQWLKALSSQNAVLASVRIRPDTDIDKLLGYWERGIQVKDVRPLLESIKRLPGGGTVNLLHLLPPFARDRLYTSPLPTKPGDPSLDCHWSTLNFFNETPDDRLADPKFASGYLSSNYYQVAKPSLYGDVILVLDEHGDAIHSGVYLADDIIFTKNGNNYAQPWKLMRLKDLTALYALGNTPNLAIYRTRNW